MIKAIIFDFYGVIRSDEYNDWLSGHGLKRSGQFKDVTSRLDKGLTTVEQFFSDISELSGIPLEQIRREFSENVSLNQELLALILELKKTYKIGLLSNASSRLRELLQTAGITKLFDYVAISSEIGVTKPDKQAFEHTLSQLGVSPEEAIFIDDTPRFVEAATALGMKGLVYTDFDSINKQLKTVGII